MQWEKKICIRLTARRILGAVLTASTVVNLVIVGAAFEAAAPLPTLTATSELTTPPSTTTFLIPTSTSGELFTATPTSGITPTDIFTPTDTIMDPPIWIVCIKRFFWSIYYVQLGDTLFSLASVTGSTVKELMSANCLTHDQIYTGQLLYVPRLPIKTLTPNYTPTDTPTPTPTDTPTSTPTDTSITPIPSATYTPALTVN